MHLILHGGPPKTGSTSIQRALWRGAEDLAAQGCLFHKTPKPAEWALQYLFVDPERPLPQVLRRSFDSRVQAREWSARAWDRFEAALAEQRPDHVVLSGEHFANVWDPEGFVARLQGLFERITFVAYARDPVEGYVSDLDERIRGGARFRNLPQVQDFRYRSVGNLRRFEELLGREAMVIRRFGRGYLQGSPAEDFYAVLGQLTGLSLRAPELAGPVNDSLCGGATAWLLSLNEVLAIQEAETEAYRALMARREELVARLRKSRELARLPGLVMSDPVLEGALRQRAAPVVAWLNQGYLSGAAALEEPGDGVEADAAELSKRLRNWLMSYVTPQVMRATARAVVEMG